MVRTKRPLVAIGTLVASLVLAGCSSGQHSSPHPSSPGGVRPSVERLRAPETSALAHGTKVGDQSPQQFVDVASVDTTVVAVGLDNSAGQQRPLFAVSRDAGRSWSRAVVGRSPDATDHEAPLGVVHGAAGWVAYGSDAAGRPVMWVSSDGTRWARESTSRVFKTSDWGSVLRYLHGRYYLFGGSTPRTRRTTQRIVMWTSKDGHSWHRADITTRLPGVAATPWIDDAIVARGELVVAGGVEDNRDQMQPDRIVIWRSRDGGRTFSKDPTSASLGGAYRAYAAQLALHDGEVLLAAAGDGGSEQRYGHSSWDAVVLGHHRAGAGAWSKYIDADFSSRVEEQPSTLFAMGGQLVMAANSSNGGEDAMVGVGPDPLSFGVVPAATLTGPGVQAISAGVAVGRARAVLVGWDDRSGIERPMVWALDHGRLSAVRLPADITGGDPSPEVAALVHLPQANVLVGGSADSPVAWSSTGFSDWRARGLAGKTAPGVDVTVADAARVGRRALAVGYVTEDDHANGIVWTRTRAGRWRSAASSALAGETESGYGYLEPAAIAGHGSTVVLAATFFNDGKTDLRPFLSTDGGASWIEGTGRRAVSLTDAEQYHKRSRWRELQGPTNGDLSVSDVAHGPKGWLIGGSITAPGQKAKPVVWPSTDGETWDGAAALPLPSGFRSGSVSKLSKLGGTWVAEGSVARSDQTPSGWASWTSKDGVHWSPPVVVAATNAWVGDVIAVPGGLLAVGSTGPQTDVDAAAWVSKDGVGWKPVAVDFDGTSGSGRQYLTTGVVDGSVLRLVGADIGPDGGGPYTVSLRWTTP